MQTGVYECISIVNIHREPRIIQYQDPKTKRIITNIVGQLKVGTQKQIYETVPQSDGSTWGRLTEADAAGIAEWSCIQDLNRVFMKLIKADDGSVSNSSLESRVLSLEARVSALEKGKTVT